MAELATASVRCRDHPHHPPVPRARGRPRSRTTAPRAAGRPRSRCGPPARHDDRAGLTVSSWMVAGGEPGRVLALLDPDADLTDVLLETGRGVVQLLAWPDRDLAEAFAGHRAGTGRALPDGRVGRHRARAAAGPRDDVGAVRVESEVEVGWSTPRHVRARRGRGGGGRRPAGAPPRSVQPPERLAVYDSPISGTGERHGERDGGRRPPHVARRGGARPAGGRARRGGRGRQRARGDGAVPGGRARRSWCSTCSCPTTAASRSPA